MPVKVVNAIKESRPVKADQWAMQRAMGIARTHLPDAPFEQRAALACDIAEALQSAWDTPHPFKGAAQAEGRTAAGC